MKTVFASAVVAASCVGLFAGNAFAQKNAVAKPFARVVDPAANGDVGPADAPVTMVIFTDFECPYSAKLFYTVQSLETAYPKQLHVVLKQSPLTSIHPEAPLAHRAALAAGRQGKFQAMAELMYANQAHLDRASLLAYARQLKMDRPRFERDMDSAEVRSKVDADMMDSRAFGVTQTPMTFLNGRILVGTQTRADLVEMIDKAAQKVVADAVEVGDSSGEEPIDKALLPALAQDPVAESGSANAPLTIVEFTDFQCPYCKAAVEPMEKLLAARGREVRWVFRAYPLDFHPDAELAAEAALAAGEQGKFWQMHDLLFANQDALKLAYLQKYADQIGLDRKRFDEALSSHKFAGRIAEDRLLGTKAGVNGTPTFIVDGQRVIGVHSLTEWNQIADAHMGLAPVVVAQKITAPVVGGQVISGTAKAPVTLSWYTDVRSPLASKQGALVRELATKYGDKVRVVYRAFPVATHADSELGGEALLAAGRQGKFWPMYDLLAERRDVLDRVKVIALAGQLGLDTAVFAAALDETKAEVQADVTDAGRRGIQGAPVIFVNAQRVDGLQRKELYTGLLDGELQNAPLLNAGR